MKDAQLSVSRYLPAAGATNYSDSIDLGVESPGLSNTWRLGRIRATIPAMPNLTDATKTILLSLQDSADDGATFATTSPRIQVEIPGVADDGSAAINVDIPLPPGLRGPIRFAQVVPAGAGDNTGVEIDYDWLNE